MSPAGADGGPELVQLLTPEGERVAPPRLRRRPDADDELPRALPRPRPRPPGRRRGHRPAAPGRARPLGQPARPGGRAGRLRPRAAARRLRLPDLPRARRRLVPRRRPAAACSGSSAASTNGGWDPHEHNFALYTIVIGAQALHAVGYAMGIAARTAPSDAVIVLLRRRRDAARATSTRRSSSPASTTPPSSSSARTTSGRSPSRSSGRPASRSTSARRRLRLPRRAGRRQRRARRARRDAAPRWSAPASGQGPTFIEAFTYRMGAHTTSDDPTRYRRRRRGRGVEAASDPIERLQGLPRTQRLADDDFFDARRRRGRGARPYGCATGCRALPDPEPLTMFDHVYAEPHPLVDERARRVRGVPRVLRRRPRGEH